MDGQTIQFKILLPNQTVENSYLNGNPDTGQNMSGRVNQILPNWQQNLNFSFNNMTDAETGEAPEINAVEFQNGLQTNAGRGNRTFRTFSADVEFNSEAPYQFLMALLKNLTILLHGQEEEAYFLPTLDF